METRESPVCNPAWRCASKLLEATAPISWQIVVHGRRYHGAVQHQRVMRHFLRRTAILRRQASPAFAIAPLTLRMHVTAAPAILVAAAGAAQGPPARRLPAIP